MNVKLHFDKKYKNMKILGSTEETTAGVNRIMAMQRKGKLRYPVIVVNEAYRNTCLITAMGRASRPSMGSCEQ